MSVLEKTSLVIFNLIINVGHAGLLYLSLSYYLHGAKTTAITGFLFLLCLVIFQCLQIVKFVEQCKYRKEGYF